jgi:hypothetical protein
MDGKTIMTMVAQRESGRDFIISRSWELITSSGKKHTMKTIEKRKKFDGKDGCIDKTILRYIGPPDHYGTGILTINYTNRDRTFWYKIERGDAGMISDTDRLRPPAESDFSFTDFLDVNPREEKHRLVKRELFSGSPCFVVESVPVQRTMEYGKRITWVDWQRWVPLKIEYFDKDGKSLKSLDIEWQNKFGFWFWEKAAVENVQNSYKTFITVDDVRINVGLHDRDVSRFGLERIIGR